MSRIVSMGETTKNNMPKATFIITDTGALVDNIMDCLYIYQNTNKDETIPYPFVVSVHDIARSTALMHMVGLYRNISYAQKHHDFIYAVDCWWRTASSAGGGELRISFRLCGIYELSQA